MIDPVETCRGSSLGAATSAQSPTKVRPLYASIYAVGVCDSNNATMLDCRSASSRRKSGHLQSSTKGLFLENNGLTGKWQKWNRERAYPTSQERASGRKSNEDLVRNEQHKASCIIAAHVVALQPALRRTASVSCEEAGLQPNIEAL